ncbi:MAG: hypothetical protein ACLQIB_07895 [Isosphaeraceae bacterium]
MNWRTTGIDINPRGEKLELALREGVPLASLDSKLSAAARSVGVVRYQP